MTRLLHPLILFLLFRILSLNVSAQVGVPVGHCRIRVDGGKTAAISCPFYSLDDHPPLTVRFESPTVDPSRSLSLRRWDVATQEYVDIPGCIWQPSGELGILRLRGNQELADAQAFLPGGGFFVNNHGVEPCDVFLHGEIVVDEEAELTFGPGLTLFGYPYTTAASLDDAQFAEFSVSPVDQALLGMPLWAEVEGERTVRVLESRPYESFFSVGQAPRVVDVHLPAEGTAATYVLAVSGEDGECIDVFAQNLPIGAVLDTRSGWELIAAGIPTEGSPILLWSDPLSEESKSGSARLIAFARSDIDTDGGGVPDGRELLAYGSNLPPTETHSIPAIDVAYSDTEDGCIPLSSIKQVTSAAGDTRGARTIYVDVRHGDDDFCGRGLNPAAGSVGPKKTIQAACRVVQPADVIRVEAGGYAGNVSIPGGVTVRIGGKVTLED